MTTTYYCSMYSSIFPSAAPPPTSDVVGGGGVHLAVTVEFRQVFQPTPHGPSSGHFPPLLGALVVPRHAFFASPAGVVGRTLSALGVRVPPSALDAFGPRLLSFSWSLPSRPLVPLSVRIVAVTCPLTFRQPLTFHPMIETVTSRPAFGGMKNIEDEKADISDDQPGFPSLRTREFWERFVSSYNIVDRDRDRDRDGDGDGDDEFILGVVPATMSFIEEVTKDDDHQYYCAVEDFSSPVDQSNGREYDDHKDEKHGDDRDRDDLEKGCVVGMPSSQLYNKECNIA